VVVVVVVAMMMMVMMIMMMLTYSSYAAAKSGVERMKSKQLMLLSCRQADQDIHSISGASCIHRQVVATHSLYTTNM
jgi:hypothetical protein